MASAPKPPKEKRKRVGGRKPIEYLDREVSYEDIKAWRASQGKPLEDKAPKFPKRQQ
jgi:hypothetical protein